jgi:hypothetical protein
MLTDNTKLLLIAVLGYVAWRYWQRNKKPTQTGVEVLPGTNPQLDDFYVTDIDESEPVMNEPCPDACSLGEAGVLA